MLFGLNWKDPKQIHKIRFYVNCIIILIKYTHTHTHTHTHIYICNFYTISIYTIKLSYKTKSLMVSLHFGFEFYINWLEGTKGYKELKKRNFNLNSILIVLFRILLLLKIKFLLEIHILNWNKIYLFFYSS